MGEGGLHRNQRRKGFRQGESRCVEPGRLLQDAAVRLQFDVRCH